MLGGCTGLGFGSILERVQGAWIGMYLVFKPVFQVEPGSHFRAGSVKAMRCIQPEILNLRRHASKILTRPSPKHRFQESPVMMHNQGTNNSPTSVKSEPYTPKALNLNAPLNPYSPVELERCREDSHGPCARMTHTHKSRSVPSVKTPKPKNPKPNIPCNAGSS